MTRELIKLVSEWPRIRGRGEERLGEAGVREEAVPKVGGGTLAWPWEERWVQVARWLQKVMPPGLE